MKLPNCKVEHVKCESCDRVTPQYEESFYDFNCIYTDCEKHIPFKEIMRIYNLRKENEKKMALR